MRLIDANELMKALLESASTIDVGSVVRCKNCEYYNNYCVNEFAKADGYCSYGRRVKDAESVRHGRWVFNPKNAIEMMYMLPRCSECGAESLDAGNYCPNCGAKMDEVKDND